MAFDANLGGERYFFGVSGLLYNSDVLFYDRKTESLWSQIKMEGVTGRMAGTKLTLLAAENTTWKGWKERHPQTFVLSRDTGYRRDYSKDPYVSYHKSQAIMFPVSHQDKRLPMKEWVLGVLINGKAKAYSFKKLQGVRSPLEDHFQGQDLKITFDQEGRSAIIEDESGNVIPSVQAYWFAWVAFYPETELRN